MSIMKLNWGTRIAVLYGGFVVLIVILVAGSMRQSFDLVSADYYGQEIKYQQVIDAGKNQSELSAPISVHTLSDNVVVNFPGDFSGKSITGTIQFYSPVNAKWDKEMVLSVGNNTMSIPLNQLERTTYKVKINWVSDGKNYYQESDINLR